MATITAANTYLDNGTTRTAGEAMTINGNGASLVVRTDTRVHANAPALLTGSLGSVTGTEGDLVWDSSAIRWLPYNTGTGNVPAIGTTITQGGVSGYLLGVWASLTSAPTAVAAAMPVTGFLKFREVAGGPYSAGALTGIGASATGPDVQGWMEVVYDQGANFTHGRLSASIARGGRFYLDNTNGVLGQTFQVPTNGGGSYPVGAWIEKTPGSANTDDDYLWWSGLNSATNGWAQQHIGEAVGSTDIRQNFLKTSATGLLTMGEAYTQSGTYASVASQTTSYASVSLTGTYIWVAGIITVDYGNSPHYLDTGMQVGLDFTSGSAVDGIFTVTVTSSTTFTVEAAGSGTGGSVVFRAGVTMTFTSALVAMGDIVRCIPTTGALPAGEYEVRSVATTVSYDIMYPHLAAISGSTGVLHTVLLTAAAVHGLAIGNRIAVDFTTGSGVDGTYPITAVPTTTTLKINMPHAVAVSGNFTLSRTIGNIAPSGCRVWIPSTILRECTTAARALNAAPNATIATRPEWTTTAAGAIDHEYVYGESGYWNLVQPYSVRMKYVNFFDAMVLQECATAIELDHVATGMYGGLDVTTFNLASCFAGGTIDDCSFQRGNVPGSSDHAVSIVACNGITFNDSQFGIIQFARSTGYTINIQTCADITLNDCTAINGPVNLVTCFDTTVNRLNHVNRYTGYANGTTTANGVTISAYSSNVMVDGMQFGWGIIPNNHPYYAVYSAASDKITVRNIGTPSSPVSSGTWQKTLYGLQYLYNTGGNNSNVRLQRLYVDKPKGVGWSEVNSDKNVSIDHVDAGLWTYGTLGRATNYATSLNGQQRNVVNLYDAPNGQSSVYGTHFLNHFTGTNFGRYFLAFNEPTTETASQFTMVSGVAKFNSAGGLLMPVIGNQCLWEDHTFRIGVTGFVNISPDMRGGTTANYTLEFQCNTGSGFSGSWTTLNGTNLSAITVDPAIGFKMKYRITTVTTNTTAITYLMLKTTTTAAAQADNLYPLDVATVTVDGLVNGSHVKAINQSNSAILFTGSAPAGSVSFTTEYIGSVRLVARKASVSPFYKQWETIVTTVSGATVSATALQELDE